MMKKKQQQQQQKPILELFTVKNCLVGSQLVPDWDWHGRGQACSLTSLHPTPPPTPLEACSNKEQCVCFGTLTLCCSVVVSEARHKQHVVTECSR